MDPTRRAMATRWSPAPLPLASLLSFAPLLTLAVYYVFAVRAGLSIDAVGRGLAGVGVTQMLPGLVVWRVLRPRDGWWFEDVMMGLILGACLAVGAQTAAGLLAIRWLALAVGPALGAVLLVVPTTRRRIRAARTSPLPVVWGPMVGGIALALISQAQAFYRLVPFGWDEGFRSVYVDVPFHVALIGQLAHRGPTEMPHVASEPLLYHWFSHAWMAQISASGVATDAVVVRFVPPLITVALVCTVAIAAVRLSGRAWAGPVAALVTVATGELGVIEGVVPGIPIAHLSPSLGFANLVLVGLLVVLSVHWRGQGHRAAVWLVPVLGFVAGGAKASALVVVVAGVGLAVLATLGTRGPARGRVVIDAVVLMAVLGLGFIALFGSRGGLALDVGEALAAAPVRTLTAEVSSAGPLTWVAAATLLMAAVLARGIGAIAVLADRDLRRDPVMYLLVGVGLAGAGAVLLLSHPGRSQIYFLRSAAPALGLATAIGVTRLAHGLDRRTLGLGVGVGVLLGGTAWGILSLLQGPSPFGTLGPAALAAAGSLVVVSAAAGAATLVALLTGRRTRVPVALLAITVVVLTVATAPVVAWLTTRELPHTRPPVAPGASRSVSADQIEASRWLRDHSAVRDLVMTNRHCDLRNPDQCGNRRFQVAAYTERRVLVEGWGYTPSWWENPDLPKSDRPFADPELLELNDAFLLAPTAALADAVRARDVRWVYIDKTAPYSASLAAFAEPRLETEWAWILELESDA